LQSTTTTTISAADAAISSAKASSLQQQQRVKVSKEIECYPKAKTYLESKARNSTSTGFTYMKALQKFSRFLAQQYPSYNIETILMPLEKKEIDVYHLLDKFVAYMDGDNNNKLQTAASTIQSYMAAVRGYLGYYDIDIIEQKFKNKVTMPKNRKEDERPLDVQDIRQIILAITNRRLRAYCLVLASGRMRATEALAIQLENIDFTTHPTRIYMKAKYSKNRLPREVYISDEATDYLKRWLDFKYDEGMSSISRRNPKDFVFALYETATPEGMYCNVAIEFRNVMRSLDDLNKKRDDGKRYEITLHSFRRFVKTVVEDQTSHSFSEYLVGHKKSPYYNKKEPERQELYRTKCMRYLTFLDYSALEVAGKSIQEAEQTKKMLEEIRLQQEILKAEREIDQANHQNLARFVMGLEKEIKINVYDEEDGTQGLLELGAKLRREREAREEKHQQWHRQQAEKRRKEEEEKTQ
jgi:integrase